MSDDLVHETDKNIYHHNASLKMIIISQVICDYKEGKRERSVKGSLRR